MSEYEYTTEQASDRIESIIGELKRLVKEHGVYTFVAALHMLMSRDEDIAKKSVEVSYLFIDKRLKRAADTCQCEACRAQRGQA